VKQESRKVKSRVAATLRMAASSLIRSQSYLGARYRCLRTRLGAPKAIKAMARYLACLVYRMFTHGQAWVDRGTQAFESKRTQRELLSLQRKAAALGYQVVVQPASA
jgi:succinylglutamate desuccinylase